MRNLLSQLLSSSLMVVYTCQDHGADSGLIAVDREFSWPALEVWDAAAKSAAKAELRISADAHDASGGELAGRAPDGSPVRIRVQSQGDRNTRVSVRVERELRNLGIEIQEGIAAALGLGQEAPRAPGGSSVSGSYSASLAACAEAARRTFEILQVAPISEETHATWRSSDGRLKDSSSVRIRMGMGRDFRTLVQFTAGILETDKNKAFAERMKSEFEILLRASTPDPLQQPD